MTGLKISEKAAKLQRKTAIEIIETIAQDHGYKNIFKKGLAENLHIYCI